MNDHSDQDTEIRNRSIARDICDRFDNEHIFCGRFERTLCLQYLETQGFDRRVLQFGFEKHPDEMTGSFGANRNWLLLLCAGGFQLSSDDDVLWESYPSQCSSGRESVLHYASRRIGYTLTQPLAPPAASASEHIDYVEYFTASLGKSIRSVLGPELPGAEQMPGEVFRDVLYDDATLTFTAAGTFGDPGSTSTLPFILGQPLNHEVVLQSLDSQRQDVLRCNRSAHVANTGPGQHMLIARDCSNDIHPYFPFGRNEDGALSFTIQQLRRRDYCLFRTLAYTHKPEGLRRFSVPWKLALVQVRISDWVMALASLARSPLQHSVSVQELGVTINSYAKLADPEFAHVMRGALLTLFSERLTDLFKYASKVQTDIKGPSGLGLVIADAFTAMEQSDWYLPTDVHCRTLSDVKHIVQLWGAFLVSWPSLVQCFHKCDWSTLWKRK